MSFKGLIKTKKKLQVSQLAALHTYTLRSLFYTSLPLISRIKIDITANTSSICIRPERL